MKKCSHCNEIKDKSEFYNNKTCKDGLQNTCKICSYKLSRESNLKKRLLNPVKKTKRDGKFLTLSGIKKEDYCIMYSALSKMGYKIEDDIHTQFCEKWGLKVSKRPRKGDKNHWTYEDCQE